MSVENTILSQLLYNDEYARRVLPFIQPEYFQEQSERIIYKTFNDFWHKYNVAPTKESLRIEIDNRDDISDSIYDDAISIVDHSLQDDTPNDQWLIDTTEQWCKDRAIYNAVMNCISIIDGDDTKHTTHAMPDILKDALSVSFTPNVGHDYLADAEDRYSMYHEDIARIPFDLKIFNLITNMGIPDGTLNVILAGTNVGKTLSMIHLSSHYLKLGKNVLYITLEMAEEEIARRVDANLFDVKINQVEKLSKDKFVGRIRNIRSKTNGNLIIKQFPTGAAHVGHFRNLLQELWLKKNFKPDVIMVDYVGICASSRIKLGNTNSYFYVKAVAEELRGLGIEYKCPVWTAVQATRGGYGNTDMDITDTAESFGLPATADFMFGVIRTDELDMLGQLLIKQLKNRYGNKNYYERFVIGVDAEKQQLFDVEDSAQKNLTGVNTESDDSDSDPRTEKPSLKNNKNKRTKEFD